jgi:hypothetical protein
VSPLTNNVLLVRILAFSLVSLLPRIAFAEPASYTVHLDLRAPLHASVEAELEATDGSLFTAKHAGGYVKRQRGFRRLLLLCFARRMMREDVSPVNFMTAWANY